ncbi:MAG: hypothetical protein M3406_17840, partial [Chloroflexota bacterium]|nr:hypothetical protein [Chloroflexota bacterium]
MAVVVRARMDYPKPTKEGAAFRQFVQTRIPTRIRVEYQAEQWPIEDIFYKWFRCEIVHAGGLRVDVGFMNGVAPGRCAG